MHSGDSACVLPPLSLGEDMLEEVAPPDARNRAAAWAWSGSLNVQFGLVDNDRLYVIEANPRASRTVPFVSKAIGVPLAKVACRADPRRDARAQDLPHERRGTHVSVKEAVLPFKRLHGSDALLGPEMKSTGEVMGIAEDFPAGVRQGAGGSGRRAAGRGQRVHLRVRHGQAGRHPARVTHARPRLPGARDSGDGGRDQGDGRPGRAAQEDRRGIAARRRTAIRSGDVDIVINTPAGRGARADGWEIRRAAIERSIPCITTMTGASAAARAIGVERGAASACARCRSCTGRRPQAAEPRPDAQAGAA